MDSFSETIIIKDIQKSPDGNRITITDNQQRYFTFFRDWQGTPTIPYTQFTEANDGTGLRVGQSIPITYTTKSGVNRRGEPVIYRNIKGFNDQAQGQAPNQAPSQSPKPSQVPQSKDVSIIRQVAFKGAIELVAAGKLDIVAVEKYTNSFNRLLLNQPSVPPVVTPPDDSMNGLDREMTVDDIDGISF